ARADLPPALKRAANRLLDRVVARLAVRFDQRYAPYGEVARLDRVWDELARWAPASETERLNHAFASIARVEAELAERAPRSEVERLNKAFDELAELRWWSRDLVLSERCVEIPWVLSRYEGEERVLEVGHANAEPRYVEALRSLETPHLVGIDLAVGPQEVQEVFYGVVADVRNPPFPAASFDLGLRISTIEHVGRDNSVYGLPPEEATPYPDHDAIRALARLLRDGGRLLLSVPYGRYEDHGWLINYDAEHLDALVEASGLRVKDATYYEQRGGW